MFQLVREAFAQGAEELECRCIFLQFPSEDRLQLHVMCIFCTKIVADIDALCVQVANGSAGAIAQAGYGKN